MLPFDPMEKQALLEAQTVEEQARTWRRSTMAMGDGRENNAAVTEVRPAADWAPNQFGLAASARQKLPDSEAR